MAEQERETKKQRRARARQERGRQAERAAQARRRNALRNGLITIGVILGAGLLVFQAFFAGEGGLDDAILVSSDEIESARQAAGCETLVEREPLPESAHFDRQQAPPPELIYPDVRPTHSGPHTGETVPPISGGASSQIDEAASTHNLEHGAVIVWYDPEQVDEGTAEEINDWARTLNNSGFQQQQGGGVIFVSPYEEPGIGSGKAVALRSWGTAVDCDEWDETVGNGFVAENYGTRGIGPEAGGFSPYPSDVLEITDQDPEELEGDGAGEEDAESGQDDAEDPGQDDAEEADESDETVTDDDEE